MRCLKFMAAIVVVGSQLFASAQTAAQTYTYDEYGRLKVVTYSANVKTGYTYDKADNRSNVQTTTNGVLNNPPACENWSFTITNYPPSYTQATQTVVASHFVARCSDADGESMTGTTVNVTVNRGGTAYVPYTVTDSSGGTGSAVLTVTFP